MWRRVHHATAIFVTAAILSGCGGNSRQTATEGGSTATGGTQKTSTEGGKGIEIKQVKIGYLANIVMPQPLVGLQNGEFEKLVPGVKFTSQDYAAGPDVMKALRAGTVDIAYTGPFPPMKAYANDKDMVLLAGAAKGGTELMVSKNSPIKTVKDLKGKVVAINQEGSTVDALVRYNLLQAGLNPDKDVTMVEIKPAQQADALKRGEAAAVAAPAPWPSVVAINGNGRPLLNWKQILSNGDYLAGVAFTTKKFATNNPNFVKQFVAAHQSITERLNQVLPFMIARIARITVSGASSLSR